MLRLESKNSYLKNKENYSEGIYMVRRLGRTNLDKNESNMIELSPDPILFHKFTDYRAKHGFHKREFESWYLDEFLESAVCNPEFIKDIDTLVDKSLNQSPGEDAAFICFCGNESICHRSIIGGILKGVGAEIDCSDDYIKYYYKFLHTADKMNVPLKYELKDDMVADYYNTIIDKQAVGIISDGFDDFVKDVINETVSLEKQIVFPASNDYIRAYLKNIGYNNFATVADTTSRSSAEIISDVSESVSVSVDKNIGDCRFLEPVVNQSKYLRFYDKGSGQVLVANNPNVDVRTTEEASEKKSQTVRSDAVHGSSRYNTERFVDNAKLFADFVCKETGCDIEVIDDIFNRTAGEILSHNGPLYNVSDEKYEKSKAVYDDIYAKMANLYDKTGDIDACDIEKGQYKQFVYEQLVSNMYHAGNQTLKRMKFSENFMKDFSENGMVSVRMDCFDIEDGLYYIRSDYVDESLFGDVVTEDMVKPQSEMIVSVSSDDSYYKFSFGSVSLISEDKDTGKSVSVKRNSPTIYIDKNAFLDEGIYVKDAFGDMKNVDFNSATALPVLSLVYLGSSNPDVVRDDSTGVYTVGGSVANTSSDSFESSKRGHWVTKERGPRDNSKTMLHYTETKGSGGLEDNDLEEQPKREEVKALAFTGHRPVNPKSDKSPDIPDVFGYKDNEYWEHVREEVKNYIVANDINVVYNGLALGFDQVALEASIELRDSGYPLHIVAAIPFRGQERAWNKASAAKYRDLVDKCDAVETVCGPGYAAWKMMKRDDYMVDNADQVLAFYNVESKSGGTKHTVDYAVKSGKKVAVISPSKVVEIVDAKKTLEDIRKNDEKTANYGSDYGQSPGGSENPVK